MEITFPGGAGRWEVRRSSFRMGGQPQQLLVLSDLTQTLREEERQAWKRLIQVLRHEINNSLAPIDSLAGSLGSLLEREPRPADWEADMNEGLSVIRERSSALNRFMTAYSRLTRLPPPTPRSVDVGTWVQRVAGLEPRQNVIVVPGPDLTIQADGDQLEQLLINLVRNAVDAARETGGEVRVGWNRSGERPPWIEVWVEDDGPGLSNTDNLFVPFFTTKPGGAGIGLALSRQIAEAHGGQLTLGNRHAGPGCRARLRLPVDGPHV
jgi:signal transduction histidine kinase